MKRKQAIFREKRNFAKMRKFRENIFAKCENFVKTMSVITATIKSSKELVEFFALIPQYLIHTFNHDYEAMYEAKFRDKSENFRIFHEQTKCENEAKWSRKKNFRETIFPFR